MGEKYEKSVQRRNCKVGFFAMFLILFTDYIFKETPCNNCILIILCYVAMSQQGEKKVLVSSNSRLPETGTENLPTCTNFPILISELPWKKDTTPHLHDVVQIQWVPQFHIRQKVSKVWQTRFLNILNMPLPNFLLLNHYTSHFHNLHLKVGCSVNRCFRLHYLDNCAMCIVYLKHLPKPGSLAESALWKLDSENKFKETALQSTPFPPP